MGLSKQEESEILDIYTTYFDNYVKGDVEGIAGLLDDGYTQIGSAESEVFFNKQEALRFINDTIDQVKGKAEIRNRSIKCKQLEDNVLVIDLCDMFVLDGENWTFYSKFRASTLMEKIGGQWKFIYQHSSMPDLRVQEGENIAIEKITKENLELRDAVKRRTVELEQKNSELAMEAALERVRTVAMGMRKPDDLPGICEILYRELLQMGIVEIRNAMINIHDDEKSTFVNYDYSDEIGKSINHLHYNIHPVIERQIKQIRGSSEAFSEFVFAGQDLADWKTFRREIGEKDDPRIDNTSSLHYYIYSIGTGSIGISTFNEISEERKELLKRFRNVFDFAYRRYLDVSMAETQAREGQIEAALERVRSRSMGMQKSEELNEVIKTVYQQLTHLKIKLDHAGFVVDYTPGGDWHFWIADERDIPSKITHPYFESVWATQFNKAKEKGVDFFATHLNFEEKNTFYTELLSYVPGLPEASKDFYLSCPGLAASTVLLENVSLYIENFSGIPYTEEENKTLMRFGKVFQQTYTRFLDLQKAESQAREAQVELGLERVRARAMAMQHTDELSELVDTVFKELTKLDFALNWCMINIIDKSSMSNTVWAANPDINEAPEPYHMLFEDYPFHDAMMKGWKEKKAKDLYVLEGEEKKVYDEYLFTDTEFRRIPAAAQAASRAMEKYVVTFTFSNFGGLQTVGEVPLSDANIDILSRFGKVFDLTYTRFNDLQKAEAQAREAQIEMALEKVRSRTMAMQNSNELQETAAVLFQEFKKLGTEDIYQVTIGIYNEKDRLIDFRATSWAGDGVQENRTFSLDMNEPTVLQPVVAAWKAKRKSCVIDLSGETLERWLNYRNKMTGITVKSADTGGRRVISVAYYSKGHLSISTPVPVPRETMQTLERFAAVFDATYTRFLDLQKAEAQAREAYIEAALERVRSRTLAMQKSDELAETAAVLFQQLISLGIEPNRLYISIIKSEKGDTEFWITDEDGSKVSTAFEANMNDNATFRKMYEGWKQQKKTLVIDMQGKELQQYFNHLTGMGVQFNGGVEQKRRVQDIAYFSKGFIGMASPDEQPAETLQLMERFAAVFNLTFTRFNDLKIAEAHAGQAVKDLIAIKEAKQKAEEAFTELQATQKQLIQSEKMASLGELTAGIAHEIQNPLNFVNNFSEVSKELLDELRDAIEKGNTEDVKDIMQNVIQNLEKINLHGKRADGIVKGMLLHSRTNSGQKEPTDINLLCEEYLRLAYHGHRAQDKSFNATMKSEFDDSIGNINIIPQDIGRVLLNLYNNAFYAVAEKKKQHPEGYDPMVTVTSKLQYEEEDHGIQSEIRNPQSAILIPQSVLIAVKDNGMGIPEKIRDKIFQPFFTTKPTGQGTGLGLSLSYDIIKAHGGGLKVKSIEGEGTEFVLLLPILNNKV